MSAASELQAAVVADYADDYLVSITNPQEPGFTTVDTTRLLSACTDVIADWKLYSVGVYDSTDATHVKVAKKGVIALLLERCGHASQEASARKAEYTLELERLGRITRRQRISPSSPRDDQRVNVGDDHFHIPRRPPTKTVDDSNQ